MRGWVILLIAGFLVSLQSKASGQGITCIFEENVGEYLLPANVSACVLDGEYGYLFYGDSESAYLRIVSIQNLSDIVTLSDLAIPYLPSKANLTGNLLFCADGMFIDVTDPAHPSIFGIIDSPRRMWSAEVFDGLAYVAANLGGVMIYDLSDPADIRLVSQVIAADWVLDIKVQGQYLYAAADEAGMTVIDIGDPYNPFIVSVEGTPGIANSLVYKDGFVYLGDSNGGLRTINVTNPQDPRTEDVYDREGQYVAIRDVRLIGDRIFCRDGQRGIYEFDLLSPESPRLINSIPVPDSLTGLGVSDQIVAAPRSSSRWTYLYDRERLPPSPLIGRVNGPYEASDMKVHGDLVYVADAGTDLYVYDIADRSSPELVSTITLPFPILSIVPGDGVVYALLDSFGLVTVDVRDIYYPVIADLIRIDQPISLNSLGHALYIADPSVGYRVLDSSEKYAPRIAGEIAVGGFPYRMLIDGNRGYFMYDEDGFRKVLIGDLSDPLRVTKLAVFVPPAKGTFVPVSGLLRAVHKNVMYQYFTQVSRMSVYDVTDPVNIIKLADEVNIEDFTGSELISGNVYTASLSRGIHVHSVTAADLVRLTGYYNSTGDGVRFVEVIDHQTIAAYGYESGLSIISVASSCDGCAADTNNDGTLSPADFTAWIAAFDAMASECDQNSDGSCTPADFTAWIANYNAGC